MARAEWRLAGLLALLVANAVAMPPALESRLDRLPGPLQKQLRARDALWSALSPAQQQALRARMAAWDALPEPARQHQRIQWQAWQELPPEQRRQLQEAARAFATLPPGGQQALRDEFAQLDATAQAGWRLGPALGADYVALQPLLLQVPEDERAPLLVVLQSMTASERTDLARIAQRTPPQRRDELRRALLSTSAINRGPWLQSELER